VVPEGPARVAACGPADGQVALDDGERVRQHVSRVAEQGEAAAHKPAGKLQDLQGHVEAKDQRVSFPFLSLILYPGR
jgi:hypothetical protein